MPWLVLLALASLRAALVAVKAVVGATVGTGPVLFWRL